MSIRDLVPRSLRRRRMPGWRRPGAPADLLHREVSRLFDDFFRGFPWDRGWSWPGRFDWFSPRLDVVEDQDKIAVSVELPGIDEKDIEVSVSSGVLEIRGEKRQERESEGGGYHRVERSYGSFERIVPLPCEIDEDRAEADFRRGVLRVTLPKSASARAATRRIPVRRVA